jgi:hypothetical protein
MSQILLELFLLGLGSRLYLYFSKPSLGRTWIEVYLQLDVET